MNYKHYYIGRLEDNQWYTVFEFCLRYCNRFKIHLPKDYDGQAKALISKLETIQPLEIRPWYGCEGYLELRGSLNESTKVIFKEYLNQSLKDQGFELWDYQFMLDYREMLYVGDINDRLVLLENKEFDLINQSDVGFSQWIACDFTEDMLDERTKETNNEPFEIDYDAISETIFSFFENMNVVDGIRYIKDGAHAYKDKITEHLRAYNAPFFKSVEESYDYFYLIEDGELLGVLYTKFSLGWIGFRSIYYNDSRCLEKLTRAVKDHYQEKMVGMKLFTNDQERVEAFKAAGFMISGEDVGTANVKGYKYLTDTDLDNITEKYEDVTFSPTILEAYDKILQMKMDSETTDDVKKEEKVVSYVALDEEKFAGGISGTITEDSMFLERLVVLKSYRGTGIGKRLDRKSVV